MTADVVTSLPPLGETCAGITRAQQVDPIGSAVSFDTLVLAPAPLPWPSDPGAHPAARAAASVPTPGATRVQLVTGAVQLGAEPLVHTRVPSEGFAGYQRADAALGRDLLICTHGSRDRCCGRLGTRLFAALDGMPRSTRAWRTSHLGGHRFAPTVLLMPEGTMWAHLDAELLHGLLHRSLPVAVLAPHYRGCTGFASPEVQVADRVGLLRHGWSWLAGERSATVDRSAGDVTHVHLRWSLPDGSQGSLDVAVRVARTLAVPACGADADPTGKISLEYVVTR